MSAAYGQHRALEDVSLKVAAGEIVVILGANGAGKSTLLRAIGGLCEGTVSGAVEMDGASILGHAPHQVVAAGIALVPEGRGVFADLTVRENLLLGAYAPRARAEQDANLDRVLALFPKLAERRGQVVRTMSGGEQQMVAIARAMMSNPQILMLDEPSLGLSPLLCRELFQTLAEVRRNGLGILLVEQNAKQSLAIADRGYLLENARIMGEDSAANLAGDTNVQKAYLGVAGDAAPQVVHAPASAGAATPTAPPPAEAGERPPAIEMRDVGRHTGAARHRTDELIGESIDDLVSRASERQAASPAHPTVRRPAAAAPSATNGGGAPLVRPDPDGARGDARLRAVLAEIERSAAHARQGNGRSPSPGEARPADEDQVAPGTGSADAVSPATPPAAKPAAAPRDQLPEIEVWRRRPKVEVWRREGGGKGKLIRVERKDDG